MSDPINPSHYKHLPAEAIDIIMAAIAKAPSNESAYLQGQVLKYLLRCWEKKGIEDLRKAKWYLDRMVNEFDDLLAEASVANETPDGGAQIPQGWRELKSDEVPSVGDKFLVDDAWVVLLSDWTVTYGAAPSRQVYIRKIELPNREEFLNEIDGVWDEGSSSDTDQDYHPHDFKVGDAVISWQGREGIVEAIGLIDDFPITVRHSIREQVSYKLGGVKKKHDDHPAKPTPWTPRIGERVIYTPSGSLWTVDRELKEKPRDGVTYILKDGTFTLRACLSRLALIEPPKRYREPTQADLANGPIECEYRDKEHQQWRRGLLVYILSGSMPFLCTDKELSGQWAQCRIEVAE